MSTRRVARVNSLLKEVISEVLLMDWKNNNLPELLTITNVEASPDLRYAKVFVSIIENDPLKKEAVIKTLQHAAGYIAVLASKKVTIRYFPELTFKIDDSIDNYMKIDTLLRTIEKETKPE